MPNSSAPDSFRFAPSLERKISIYDPHTISDSVRHRDKAVSVTNGASIRIGEQPLDLATMRIVNPLVSIVVPTHNNESTILRTLSSLTNQTLLDIEIIVVDDASTDNTLALCDDAESTDSRITLITCDTNRTVLQTRRIGVQHAAGTYVMFCDADDELVPQAAEEASTFAQGGGYDIVHFGTTIVSTTGSRHGAWERSLDPFGTELFGTDILSSSPFGQRGAVINGHVWNKLYDRNLVQNSWDSIDPELRLPRAQDVFQTLLILANATRYGGLDSPLYRYNFRAGKSGNVGNRDTFQHFLASSLTYHALAEHLATENWNPPPQFNSDELLSRVRDQFIGNQLKYWLELPQPAEMALSDLFQRWQTTAILSVLAKQYPSRAQVVLEALNGLDYRHLRPEDAILKCNNSPRIALLGNITGAGGVQKVMAVQAALLIKAGYSVTIISFEHNPENRMPQFPLGVTYRSLGSRRDVGTGVSQLISHLQEGQFSAVLNHENYSPLLPWIPVVTRSLGIPCALFLHSFSLRGLFDFREVFGYLPEIAQSHDLTVTLSDADRMWWQASGVSKVQLLPNFATESSDLSLNSTLGTSGSTNDTSALDTSIPPVDLLWVGRLHDDTKNITGLLRAFAQVVAHRPSSTLAVVGGERGHGELARLERVAESLGVRDSVLFAGATKDVNAWYSSAKVFVATSIVEGFNLTLVEAQEHGLPVVMYDLPYLEAVRGNPGIEPVKWGASEQLAQAALYLLENPDYARHLGTSGREFVRRFSLANYDSQLQSIIDQLLNATDSPSSASYESDPDDQTALVPTSVLGELYRLYKRMNERVSAELRASRRESAELRNHISQLKTAVAESKAQHQRFETTIAQVEKKQKVPKQQSPKVTSHHESQVGGIWPLWARERVQPLATPTQTLYDDVSLTDPATLPIAWAVDCGILIPDHSRHLEPGRPATRYEFITMLYRLAGSPEAVSEVALYRDLNQDDPVAAWAAQRKILRPANSRKVDGDMRAWNPHSSLIRRSAAMILYRAAGSPSYKPPRISPYADISASNKSYKEMCWASHQGVLPATRSDDTFLFEEQSVMTRSEAISALFRQMVGPVATPAQA